MFLSVQSHGKIGRRGGDHMRIQHLFWATLAWAVMTCWGYCQSYTPSSNRSVSTNTDQSREWTNNSGNAALSSTRPRYYDQRERVAAAQTFEWESESIFKFSKSYLESSTGVSSQSLIEKPVDDSEQLLLRGVFRAARLPQILHIRKSQEIPHLANGSVRKSDDLFKTDFYYLGETGEIMLYLRRGKDDSVRTVSIVSAGTNGLGLRPPFPGLSLGDLVFLAGVSPLRLMDVEPTDWQLREVNEQEWIFELQPDAQMKARSPWLQGTQRVTVHLNRQKGDAPAKVEISQGDTTETWHALAYKQVQGVWMPERVLLEYKSPSFEIQSLYYLRSVSRTVNVRLDIPRGTLVLDWRWRKRAPWTEGIGAFALSLSRTNENLENTRSLEWSPELESSLWRDLRQYQRDDKR